MSTNERNFSVAAFLVGGILGASASLLFTPSSGREIRSDIKLRAKNHLNEARSKADSIISNSKSAGELLKRKAEDLMETVKQYANGKTEKPLSVIENEIAGLRAAISAVRTSYSVLSEIHPEDDGKNNVQLRHIEFENEKLPKHIGMGKGKGRKNHYS